MPNTLQISDGVTTVNLITNTGTAGFHLDGLEMGWKPATPDFKNGGTWQDSPFADERRLRHYQWTAVIDTFNLHIEGPSQDDVIAQLQDLRRLLVQASDYYASDWTAAPVFLLASAATETNVRFAYIHKGRLVADDNPYICRFNGGVPSTANRYWMWNLTLVVEHGIWLGTVTATALSAVESYDGRNLGTVNSAGVRTPSTVNYEVFIGNKRNIANLSDVYVDNGGAWTGNQMGAALPWNLLSAVPAVNDALYLGIDTTLANSGPFNNLVFSIGTAGAGYTAAWEYWSGAAWVALTVQDNTDSAGGTPFSWAGSDVRTVHWSQPTNWATRNLALDGGPGITGYFVRVRVTAAAGPTAPTQTTRNVYSIIWPYTEIQSTEIGGDIPALAKESYQEIANTSIERCIMGMRSMSRGTSFTAYLNAADEQNPAGITSSVFAAGAFANNYLSPTGRAVQFAPAGISALVNVTQFALSTTISSQYSGQYHVFLRASQVGGTAGDMSVKLLAMYLTTVNIFYESEEVFLSGTDAAVQYPELIDLGKVTVPQPPSLGQIAFRIQCANTNAAPGTLYIYDLVLIPVDEWALDTSSFDPIGTTGQYGLNEILEVDSISQPKTNIITSVTDSSGREMLPWIPGTSGKAILQANVQLRLWYTWAAFDSIQPWWRVEFEQMVTVTMYDLSRYLSMRGAR